MTKKKGREKASTSKTKQLAGKSHKKSTTNKKAVVKPHKKPEEPRGRLEWHFLEKTAQMPDGEICFMLTMPAAHNGPVRVNHHNMTKEQTVAMVEALNSTLPYPQKRLKMWVEKTTGGVQKRRQRPARQQRKGQQAHSGEQEDSAHAIGGSVGDVSGNDSMSDLAGDATADAEIQSGDEDAENMGDADESDKEDDESDKGEGAESDEETLEEQEEEEEEAHQDAADEDDNSLESRAYEAVMEYLWITDDEELETLSKRTLREHFARKFRCDPEEIRGPVKRALNDYYVRFDADADAEGGEPLAGADSHTAAPESMASRSPVQAAAARQARPSRAAANGVAALLLQQKLDGGLSSSGSGHARTGKLPAALSAKLKPEGTVQEAAVAAETATALATVFKQLRESVVGSKTTVKQAQADLRFADKAQAAVKSGVWHAQVVKAAINAAQTAVNMQQLEAARSRR